MPVAPSDPTSPVSVVLLAGRDILEMDLRLALAEAGFAASDRFPRGRLAAALIVDADALDRRSAAMVRRHAKAGVPVMIITNDETGGDWVAGQNTLRFRKPLVSDEVVTAVARLVQVV